MKKLNLKLLSILLMVSILVGFAYNPINVSAASMADEAIPLGVFEIMPCDIQNEETKYFLIETDKAGTLNVEIVGANNFGWDSAQLYDLEGALVADKGGFSGGENFMVHLEKGSYYLKYNHKDDATTLTFNTTFTPDKVTTITLKITIKQGSEMQLGAIVNPSSDKVTWKSSKKSVAKVSSNGLVTAVKKGTAKIYAVLGSGKMAEITVVVN